MDDTEYKLSIIGEVEDSEYLMFKLHKAIPEAKSYIDDDGSSLGSGYDWREFEHPLRDFSRLYPNLVFLLEETQHYDGTTAFYRHYFKAGGAVTLEPKITVKWPEFSDNMLA